MLKRKKQSNNAQAIIEFIFAMFIVMLMIYGTMMVFRWTGVDLAGRRVAHEIKLLDSVQEDYVSPQEGPLKQITPFFYKSANMNAVWDGD